MRSTPFLCVLLCVAGSQLSSAVSTCEQYSNCLDELHEISKNCYDAAFAEQKTSKARRSSCINKIRDKEIYELKVDYTESKEMADCIRTRDVDRPCPFMSQPCCLPRRRRKRAEETLAAARAGSPDATGRWVVALMGAAPSGADAASAGDIRRRDALIRKIYRECENAQDLLWDLERMDRARRLKDKGDVINVITKRCDGEINVRANEVPNYYPDGDPADASDEDETSEASSREEALREHLEEDCRNHRRLLNDLDRAVRNKEVTTPQEAVNFLEEKCDGDVNIKVRELPRLFVDCPDLDAKRRQCTRFERNCEKLEYCELCFRISPLHDGKFRNQLGLIQERRSCDEYDDN